MLCCYCLALLSSIFIGGLLKCIFLIGLGYWYNDLQGADCSCVVRQFVNACGYLCFLSGAVEVMTHCPITSLEPKAYQWLAIVGAVILTTIQTQDMPDQVGDSIRNRQTLPLVIGDSAARSSIAIAIGFWSYFCPAFWRAQMVGVILPIALGIVVAGRFLEKRTIEADKVSFRMYNLWIVCLFLLPQFRN